MLRTLFSAIFANFLRKKISNKQYFGNFFCLKAVK
jgi:hypothetical protein